MDRNRILERLGQDWPSVTGFIQSSLKSEITLLNTVNGGILSHGGKMLRPLVSLLVSRLCAGGAANDDSLKLAAASELLHNATLLHDDVADESDTRRGRPTVRSLIGPSSAVLVGDFWLARTVDLLMTTACRDKVVPLYVKTMSDLAEGEMLQLEKASSCDTVEDDYFRIIYCKTVSLFKTTCAAAAISEGASQAYTDAAERYAVALGMAFQIRDDILDYEGNAALGKPVGIDLKERKITLPLLGALKQAEDEGSIRNLIHEIDNCPENCEKVRKFVIGHGGIDYAVRVLDGYVEKAVEALAIFPDLPEKRFLEEIARYNAFRKN